MLPEYFDYRAVGDYGQLMKDNYAKCRDDETLLGPSSSIGNILTYINEKRCSFRDEDVSVIGFPTMKGDHSGDYIDGAGFGILSTSKNKDAAWEFIKCCLSDDFTDRSSNLFVMIPTKSSVNIYNEFHSGEYIYYSDADLDRPSYSNSAAKEVEISSGPGIWEKVNDWIDEFTGYLESVDNYVYKDKDVVNIVNEEISVYINSSKSIEDTVKAIQSRVSIYMSEMWG